MSSQKSSQRGRECSYFDRRRWEIGIDIRGDRERREDKEGELQVETIVTCG